MEDTIQEKTVQEILTELLEQGNLIMLRSVLTDLHPADIAEAMGVLDREDRVVIFDVLDKEQAAEVLVNLDEHLLEEILEFLNENQIAEIIGHLDSDDAADIISELDDEVAHRVLALMPKEDYREVKTLLRHDEDTAGGIMALEIIAVSQNSTTAQAMEILRQKADEVDDVYNIYVVDTSGILVGILSLKDLVLAKPRTPVSKVMDSDPVRVLTTMDQEEVASLFSKYDLVAAPVVDETGRLVGRITVDDVLDVVEEEASEDFTRMAGITTDQIGERSVLKISGVRLPWLMVAFIGEMISAMVLKHFQASMEEILMAAFFIPLIMAMGGNTGIQSSTIVIRGLATGDIQLRDTWPRLGREISAAILNGIIIGLCLIGVVTWFFKDPSLGQFLGIPTFGIMLAIALMAVLINASFMGTMLPLFFKKIRIDPAIATGPFISTSNDVLGLLVYFGVLTASQHLL
ncbi:magnesium transporter [bacterium]|nr:magnesium transporter [bacterium]